MTATFDCCDHCEHDINDPPHDAPCPEGCSDEWDDAISNAYQDRVEAGLEQEDHA